VTAFGSAAAIPHNGALWLVARILLDAAGGSFGLYLVGAAGLWAAGRVLRRRSRAAQGAPLEAQ
jgi:hypothetical protein